MAIAIRSSTTAAYTTATTLVITKPSGLVVGDYLVAHISGGGVPSSLPSGFSLIRSDTSTAIGSFYGKFADSGDVAASTFTFGNTGSGGGQLLAGALIAMTGVHTASPSTRNAYDNDAATPSTFTNTVTPDNPDSLLLLGVGSFINSTVTITSSAYSIATSNPSWTELYDQSGSDGSNTFQMALAYATRPQTTATGNSSASFSTGTDFIGTMIVIRPQLTATITESLTMTETLPKTVGKVIAESLALTEVLTPLKSKVWNTLDKSSSTWINQDKS